MLEDFEQETQALKASASTRAVGARLVLLVAVQQVRLGLLELEAPEHVLHIVVCTKLASGQMWQARGRAVGLHGTGQVMLGSVSHLDSSCLGL